MRTDSGFMMHVDGIDGAGKSTLLDAARTWATTRRLTVFDAVSFSKTHGRLPNIDDFYGEDVLLSAEPTHTGVGKIIREVIVATGTKSSARTAANAFALDRMVLLETTILPFLNGKPKRIVIQDRGLFTSLAYQPLQAERFGNSEIVTPEQILALDGNRFALEHAPNVFVFLDVDAKEAERRLANRAEKDDAIFEQTQFQIDLSARYRDPKLFQPLAERGTQFVTLDGGHTREEVASDMRALLDRLIPSG